MFTISRFSKALGKAVLTLATGALVVAPLAAQSSDPERLKAAIVFNVLRFVDLPDSGRGPMVFCVSANDPAARSFQAFSGRAVGSRTVSVRTVRNTTFNGCDVVYLGSASSRAVANASASGRLVMGDGRSFIDRGGSVGLVRMGSQIRFEINLDAAAKSNVRISSKLIRLAARVER